MANKHAIERRINRLENDLYAKELRNRIALGKLVEAVGLVEEDHNLILGILVEGKQRIDDPLERMRLIELGERVHS